jgi:hypothetical protein
MTRGPTIFLLKKSAPEIVGLGGRNGRLPPEQKTRGCKWGVLPPTCARRFLGRETAGLTPKIYEFQGRLLKYELLDLWVYIDMWLFQKTPLSAF